jgi:hypothetical protein
VALRSADWLAAAEARLTERGAAERFVDGFNAGSAGS